jgi:hypothetical protein
MARYYFDFRENSGVLQDDVGVELADAETAELEAVKTVTAVAEENFLKGNRSVIVNVREGDRPAFRVSLTLAIEHP